MTRSVLLLFALLLLFAPAAAQERFPTPEFESGYEIPVEQNPGAPGPWRSWLDLGLYGTALALAAWFLLGRRRRRALAFLAFAALLYFGFVKEGCICPVGSIGNVARGLFSPEHPVPLAVVGLFLLPLLASLLWGRVFCGAVCPLGAIQDLCLVKPLRVPRWLDEPLSLCRWLYLFLVVLAVYGAGRFLVCRFDPFVGFFRLGGSAAMLITGGAILLLGTVVGRPYCRWVCPYGALLGLFSRFSLKRVRVTPGECVKCGLCADACPYGAIRTYQEPAPSPAPRRPHPAWFLLLLLPLAGGLAGPGAGRAWAEEADPVSLYREVLAYRGGPEAEPPDRIEAFRRSGLSLAQLRQEALDTVDRFRFGATVAGIMTGVLFAAALFGAWRRRPPEVVEVDAARCLSCGRCYDSCPVHRAEAER